MASGQSDASLGKQLRTLFNVGTLTGLSDGELLDRFLDRHVDSSEPAFGVLVERHGPMVLGVCRRILGDGHLAEDAFQATFLILARRGASIRRGSSIGGWLHRVAKRTALRARKQADRRRSIENTEVNPDAVAVNAPEPVESRELRSAIDEELDRLNESQRQAVVLCCVQGMSHEQAAGVLRWPVGTVKSRLGRGREQLRLRLIRRGFAPGVAWPLGADFARAKLTVFVPKALADAAAKSAFQFVAGSSASGAIASAVATLANGEMTTMMLGKWKAVAMALAASTAAVGLAGIAVAWSAGAPPQDAPKIKAVAVGERKEPTSSPILLSAKGQVVDAQGKPVVGATVYLREWASLRTHFFTQAQYEPLFRGEALPDILAQTQTDSGGRYEFKDVKARPFSEREMRRDTTPWDVVAIADGHGLAWTDLSMRKQRSTIVLTLPDETVLRGRITEPGGKPVAGAKIQVFSISPLGELEFESSTTDWSINLNYSSIPIRGISGTDGRFEIRGLPRDVLLTLVATEAGHERQYVIAATTDRPQPELRARSATGARKVHNGELSIETKPTDHRLVGRVVFEEDGTPAAGAMVLADSQRSARTDPLGRFEIAELPAGTIVLHIHQGSSTKSAPLDVSLDLPTEPKLLEKTFVLPRGLIVQGKVVDGASLSGIGGVDIDYSPPDQMPEGKLRTIFGLNATTDADGRFRIAVPSGLGSLRLVQLPSGYAHARVPTQGAEDRRLPVGDGLKRKIDGESGQTLADVDFLLDRGAAFTLRIIDADGHPVSGAAVKRRDWEHLDKPAAKTDRDGRFEAEGLDANTRYTFDVYDTKRDLGARFVSPATASHEGPMTFDVKVQPLTAVRGRVLDEEGKPIQKVSIRLANVGAYPDDFGTTDGSFRFDRLIPGAEYELTIKSSGFASIEYYHFTPKP